MIFDVNGGVGNQLFHLSTALAFTFKFKVDPELNLRGCDTSRGGAGVKWQLDKLLKFVQKDFNLGIRRSRNVFEDSYLKIIDKINKPTYIDKDQIENLLKNGGPLSNNFFIPHIESKVISKFALENGFAKILKDYRNSVRRDLLICAPDQDAVAIHLRRLDGQVGFNNLDDWYLKNKWYENILSKHYSESKSIYIFTNSLVDAEFFREINPKVQIFGPEITPLNTILSLSTFDHLVLSRSTLSYWAGEISDAQSIYSAFPSTHNFSPNSPYSFIPPL
jgi:hypothetical protein